MKNFIEAIDRFERIRLASVKLARPNPGWAADYQHFKELQQGSNARTIEVSAAADRGDSLQKNAGLVQRIKQFIGSGEVPVKTAMIEGKRTDEGDETSISLSKFVEHRRVSVRLTRDGHVDDSDIMEKLSKFLSERPPGRRS
jgi:hypothetical protein